MAAERQSPTIVYDQAMWAILAVRTVHANHWANTRLVRGSVAYKVVYEGSRPCVRRLELETVRKLLSYGRLQAVVNVAACARVWSKGSCEPKIGHTLRDVRRRAARDAISGHAIEPARDRVTRRSVRGTVDQLGIPPRGTAGDG